MIVSIFICLATCTCLFPFIIGREGNMCLCAWVGWQCLACSTCVHASFPCARVCGCVCERSVSSLRKVCCMPEAVICLLFVCLRSFLHWVICMDLRIAVPCVCVCVCVRSLLSRLCLWLALYTSLSCFVFDSGSCLVWLWCPVHVSWHQ